MNYDATYRASVDDPNGFWLDAARALDWANFPTTALEHEDAAWFAGGTLNICHNAIDRHVDAGRGDDPALIFESPVTGNQETYSFADLQSEVAQTAGMLAALGTAQSDRVIIYMPMIPQAVFAMLACARIGAVHSVVFGGFSAAELAKRIDDCDPTLILTASCGIEGARVIPYKPIVDDAITLACGERPTVALWQRPQLTADLSDDRDVDWNEAVAKAEAVPCVDVAADHPLYILYTSGTTGKPKGVVRETGGYAVALAWSMSNIYGVQPGETYWAASDIGWVVGHSYIVYGPLLNGNATVLFEGKPVGTPNAGIFWEIVSRHNVSVLFTAPTAIRAIRAADPDGELLTKANPQSLRALFLAGERADPDTVEWVGAQLDRPVIDHWWQTELGWPALATCIGLGSEPAATGAAGYPVPGFAFDVVDDDGVSVASQATGNLVIAKPLPPGSFRTLWLNQIGFDGYFESFDGRYATGDAGVMGADGSYCVMGRTDDIINVAGHRISTGQIEEVVAGCQSVVECAVIGGRDELKGEVPVAFFVAASDGSDQPEAEIIQAVRTQISPIATPRDVVALNALPKTRSGKILRNLLRAIVNGDTITIPQTIEDPIVVEHAQTKFANRGDL
ncbi:AMP-binding protein [Erythrobacter sp. Alg231-14]|uniref:AMP-binding protein n=1 Tax=Erythrobacter sp. Alg231-14 TaxID=1922225 RepID=UPI00307B5B68